jgi:DNA-directed RNA polymerase specialized sigma24 family protein
VPFETDLEQWQAGERRLDEAPPDQQRVLEAVTRRVYDELRRRLGGPFTTEELVQLYDEGTGWISDLAVAVAPDDPYAWDVRIVGDAAFARYVRRAKDWAGGRRE